MSYTPTQWNTGDTITASALNKIENGIANAGGNVYCVGTRSGDIVDFGITIGDAIDAMKAGRTVILYIPDDHGIMADTLMVLLTIYNDDGDYLPCVPFSNNLGTLMAGGRSDPLAIYLD